MSQTVLRLPEVLRQRGISRSTHYTDIQRGLYTRAVAISTRAVGWPEYEVEALFAARIAGKSPNEIRALVRQLEANRLSAA